MKWISVKDSLPEVKQYCVSVKVIVAIYDGSSDDLEHGNCVTDGVYHKELGWQEWVTEDRSNFLVPMLDDVTHWMYFPAAPKKGVTK